MKKIVINEWEPIGALLVKEEAIGALCGIALGKVDFIVRRIYGGPQNLWVY